MKKPLPEGSTYVCSTWGYVMEKRDGRWQRQHRLVMEEKLGRKLKPGEVVHHKNEVKTDNDPDNLELTSRSAHQKTHNLGAKRSEETRERMREGAARRVARPDHREHLSDRAKKQHAERRFGY